jgi:hypothetical protein
MDKKISIMPTAICGTVVIQQAVIGGGFHNSIVNTPSCSHVPPISAGTMTTALQTAVQQHTLSRAAVSSHLLQWQWIGWR